MAVSIDSEYAHLSLGDARLDARAVAVLKRWQAKPGASFPKMVESNSELQGLYGLLENETVDHRALLEAHVHETYRRMAEAGASTVLVLHDTTTFSFGGDSERDGVGWISSETQGFNGHFALAVSTDGARRPFGVVGLSTHMRPRPEKRARGQARKKIPTSVRAADPTRESLRWSALTDEVSNQLRGRAVPIHVMDREGDAYVTLAAMERGDQRFIVRASELDRSVLSADDGFAEPATLRHVAERSVPVSAREIQISRRPRAPSPSSHKKHPPRNARVAKLEIAAQRVRMSRPKYLADDVLATIDVNIVHVRELDPPVDVEPVEWFLLTTETIATAADVVLVVDQYRARWTIEEFFKAIKTGCAYEQRQLESAHALLVALALCIPVAWEMLALRHQSRTEPTAPASTVISAARLFALRTIARGPLPKEPTVQDVFYAIAAIGGHIARNGPPGWLTLRSGFNDLLLAERVLAGAKSIERCDQW